MLDLRSGELKRDGRRTRLQGQPGQLLAILVSRSGELVTREELRAKLWPKDTFVDFDHGLNNAVNRIREALGDSAGSPRYVETVPRKGYRFICPIDEGQAGTMPAVTDPATPPTQGPGGFGTFAKIFVAALLLAMVGGGLAGFRYMRPHPALNDQDVIVLADLDNRTGEPVFENTLKEALAIDLEQSPFISTLPDSRVNQTLKMMERSPGDRLTSEVAREICLRTSSKALLTGSLASVGSHYLLQLKVGNCQTGETLAADQAEAESREKVLQRLGEAAARLRSKLGESLASVRKYDRPLEEVTTPSLEALQAYSEGVSAWDEKGDAAAVPFFERAVELDPNFAAAYNFLHWCYGNLGKAKLSMESMRRAYALRDHLVEPEKYFTSAWYYSSFTGEIPKAVEQLQILLQEYPKHNDVHGALGEQYKILGQPEKAAAEHGEQVRLFPSDILGYNLFYDDLAMNRLEEARAVLNQGFSRMPEHPWLHQMSYYLAFVENDDTTMQQQLSWARGSGTPALESQALGFDANTQIYHGRLAKGRKVLQAARDSANREGLGDAVALFHAGDALVEAEFGNHDRAGQAARSAVARSSDRLVRATAGLALATAGDLAGAQQQLDFLNHEFPLNTLAKNYWVPAIQAQIELRKGHASRAIEFLQLAAPYELSDEAAMYPVFARGQAYIASGDGAAAAAEFQKILGHRGLVANDAVGALAHLYVGRARALEARSLRDEAADRAKAQARAAYQDFFNLWRDADSDIPILRQAKAEYMKLQ